MTHTAQFTATVRAVQNVMPHLSVYDLIMVADEVCRVHDMPVTDNERPNFDTHESRVQAALASNAVLDALRDSKKILAIKELRLICGCGLKDAKDAVEDPRVLVSYVRRPPGW